MAIYGGKTTIHVGDGRENFLLLPIIPDRSKAKSTTSKAGKTAKRSAAGTKSKSRR